MTTTERAYAYDAGIDPLAAMGAVRAFGDNILCRAILATDAYAGPLAVITYDATSAEAFEVVNVGGACAAWCEKNNERAPVKGDHIAIKSTAADRISAQPTGRYWLVPIADVAGVIDRIPETDPTLRALIDAEKENSRARGLMPSQVTPGMVQIAPAR